MGYVTMHKRFLSKLLRFAAVKQMESIHNWLRLWPLHGLHGRTKQNGQQICRPLQVQEDLEY
jgi:hypothetical protein